MRRLVLIWGVLSIVLLVMACGERQSVSPKASTQRLVSIDPSVTSLIVALDRKAWLVGVTKHCEVSGIPIVGDMRPSAERILSQRPTLVLSGSYAFNEAGLQSLRAAGLPLLTFPAANLQDMKNAIGLLGKTIQREAKAKQLSEALDSAIATVRKQRPTKAPKVLVIYAIDAGYVYTSGGGDHIMEMVGLVGGVNAAQGGPLTKRLALSQVVSLAPEMILHVAPEGKFNTEKKARAFWNHMQSLPAVKQKMIFVWPDNALARRDARVPQTLLRLSRLIRKQVMK